MRLRRVFQLSFGALFIRMILHGGEPLKDKDSAWKKVVRPAGFEPATSGSGGQRSVRAELRALRRERDSNPRPGF